MGFWYAFVPCHYVAIATDCVLQDMHKSLKDRGQETDQESRLKANTIHAHQSACSFGTATQAKIPFLSTAIRFTTQRT